MREGDDAHHSSAHWRRIILAQRLGTDRASWPPQLLNEATHAIDV
jgi:hypothetical protein